MYRDSEQENLDEERKGKGKECEKTYQYKTSCFMKQPMFCPMMMQQYPWCKEEMEDEESESSHDDSRIVRPYHHYMPYYHKYPYFKHHHHHHPRPHFYHMPYRDAEFEDNSGEEEEYRPINVGGFHGGQHFGHPGQYGHYGYPGHYGHFYHPYYHHYYPPYFYPNYPYYEDYYDGYSE